MNVNYLCNEISTPSMLVCKFFHIFQQQNNKKLLLLCNGNSMCDENVRCYMYCTLCTHLYGDYTYSLSFSQRYFSPKGYLKLVPLRL